MQKKIDQLRLLIDEVGLVTQAQLARRWGVSREAVRQFMDDPDAPEPVFTEGTKLWAIPEVDAFRTRRLARAGRRGGKH